MLTDYVWCRVNGIYWHQNTLIMTQQLKTNLDLIFAQILDSAYSVVAAAVLLKIPFVPCNDQIEPTVPCNIDIAVRAVTLTGQ